MIYRTTCPHCASIFQLGTDQLDAAQGWVQCSVCGAPFDAHPSLLMADGSPLPPPKPAFVETPPPPEATLATAPESIELAPAPAALDEAFPDIEAPEALAAPETPAVEVADMPRGIAERDAPSELPSIILIDPDISAPDDPGPLPHIYPPRDYPRTQASAAQGTTAARIEYVAPQPGTARIPATRRRGSPWGWALSSALLLVLLLVQSAYFFRDTIVSQQPQTRPLFEQACARIGCTLSLPKNLALLQIVGSDLQTETSGRLKLALTLGNRASHAQAWPVLVLTLTDQRNQPLARRSFAPSEYLGDPQRIIDGMPPRSEQALNLPLTVHNLAPMGFNLQLTY
ncbi:MAG: DUF3426 domain-containing protein [Thiobacillus sp.]